MPEGFDHAAAQSAFMEHVDAQEDAEPEVEETYVETAESEGADDVVEPITDAPTDAVVADPYEQYGGEDTVKNAMIVANALKTEQGIRQLTARGLQTLGYSSSDIEAFLASQAAQNVGVAQAAAEPEGLFAGREDDDLLTVAEARQFQADLQRQIAEARDSALAPFQQQQQEAQYATAQYTADSTLVQLLGDPEAADPNASVNPELAQIVLSVANTIIDDDKVLDPTAIRAALTQAHAQVVQAMGEAKVARVAAKRAVKDSLPTKVGGQGAGADAPREPQNMKEADAAFFALMDLPAPPR